MRILYFADVRFPLERANGIQTMETCHALAGRGHEVTLFVRPDTHAPPRDPHAYYGLPALDRLRIERARVAGPPALRRASYVALASARAAGRTRADLVFTRDLGVAAVLLRLPAIMRPPLVYESHGYAPDVARALPDLVSTASRPSARKLTRLARREARVWQEANGYVVITDGLRQALEARHGSRPRVAVVPDGVRLGSGPIDAPREPGPGFTVAYAGHLYPWKGVDVLLQALVDVPEAHGLIVGGHGAEPDLARLKDAAVRLGVAGRVTFTGLVDPGRVPGLLASADALALPNPASAISTAFTSPLKLFEYMAAGRPIIASDLPAIREVLHDDVDALLVAPGDPRALAAAIRRLSADRRLGARLARGARDGAPEYSWARRAERLEALFRDVAGAS